MIKRKIVYVDEEGKEIRDFKRKFGAEFDVCGLLPGDDLDAMVEAIFDAEATAVITDFNLAEYKTDVKYTVPYDGVKLVESIRKIRHGFPCFILTSYDGVAIQESDDVNLIYPKDTLNLKVGNTTMQEKVHVQIEHYLAHLNSSSKEFNRLMEKSHAGGLTEKEESRLFELDTILENTFDGRKALPKTAKNNAGIRKLSELLKTTDDLINELRKEKRK